MGDRWSSFNTAGGKNVQVRLQRVNQPGVTEIRTLGTHEKVSMTRAGKAEGSTQ